MTLEEFEQEYIARLKEIRQHRDGESVNQYVRRCWREEAMLPPLPIDLLDSEAFEMKYGSSIRLSKSDDPVRGTNNGDFEGDPSSAHCLWQEDNDGVWQTSCEQVHVFIDGTPGQNNYGFCPYCGRPLSEIHTPVSP